jgi:hypothetical protein
LSASKRFCVFRVQQYIFGPPSSCLESGLSMGLDDLPTSGG